LVGLLAVSGFVIGQTTQWLTAAQTTSPASKVASGALKKKPALKKSKLSGKSHVVIAKKKQAPSVTFDQARAWNHLEKQMDFGPRVPGTKAHDLCQDYIYQEMRKYCDDVRLQPFSHVWSQTKKRLDMNNIIGTQNWSNSSVKVVLVTHWDSRPEASEETDPRLKAQPVPGANDGASGVAVLLELMRVFKEKAPNVGILYFMTDGEDLGPGEDEMYLGAVRFTKDMPKATYGILLDMIGDRDLTVPIEGNSQEVAPDLVEALYNHAAKIGLKATFPKYRDYYIDDDHLALIEAGLPTIDLIDFRYPWWHKVTDTKDKCSADSLGKIGKLLETWFTTPKPWRPGIG
jgi:glutaminyl-peptide cyclotransferase